MIQSIYRSAVDWGYGWGGVGWMDAMPELLGVDAVDKRHGMNGGCAGGGGEWVEGGEKGRGDLFLSPPPSIWCHALWSAVM